MLGMAVKVVLAALASLKLASSSAHPRQQRSKLTHKLTGAHIYITITRAPVHDRPGVDRYPPFLNTGHLSPQSPSSAAASVVSQSTPGP